MKKISWFLVAVITVVSGLTAVSYKHQPPQIITPLANTQPIVPPKVEPKPRLANISVKMPPHLNYNQITAQLDKWHEEAPDLTERGSYGQSTRRQLLQYIRVTNLLGKSSKKVILITACLHGNEPLSTSEVMAYIGTMLSDYGKNQEITELIDTRDIYFIPVVSPDSYPNSRFVDGVDPNRNFPGPKDPNRISVPPVKALQDFFLKIKPKAVISSHSFGRVYLMPYGDQNIPSPNVSDYKRILGQMKITSGYRIQQACEVYGQPIQGSEVDWYYRGGAFAIVCEFGTHQQLPKPNEIKSEFDKTWQGFIYFLKESPKVEIKNQKYFDLLFTNGISLLVGK